MGLGVGIFLIAVGAILTFAVNSTSGAVDIDAVGWILMAVGLASVVLSLASGPLILFGRLVLGCRRAAEHPLDPPAQSSCSEALVHLCRLCPFGLVPILIGGFRPENRVRHVTTISRDCGFY